MAELGGGGAVVGRGEGGEVRCCRWNPDIRRQTDGTLELWKGRQGQIGLLSGVRCLLVALLCSGCSGCGVNLIGQVNRDLGRRWQRINLEVCAPDQLEPKLGQMGQPQVLSMRTSRLTGLVNGTLGRSHGSVCCGQRAEGRKQTSAGWGRSDVGHRPPFVFLVTETEAIAQKQPFFAFITRPAESNVWAWPRAREENKKKEGAREDLHNYECDIDSIRGLSILQGLQLG